MVVQTQLADYLKPEPQQTSWIGFSSRHPYTTDAYELGFLTGWRQHTSGYQQDSLANVRTPILFLDNDFHDPDLDGFLELVDRYEPDVAIIGDATTREEAAQYQRAATDIREQYDDVEPVIVPKCRDAFDALDQDTVLGWPNGYAHVNPFDYSELRQWRGRPTHILGGSPHSQLDAIDLLTQPTLDDQPPSNIVGLDGNGCYKAAFYGEYWTPNGYEPADHLSLRETVCRSLQEMKGFWQGHGIWPNEEPIDRYGPAVKQPDDHIWMDQGGDPIGSHEELEAAYVAEYDNRTMAFQSEKAKRFVEYRVGLKPYE